MIARFVGRLGGVLACAVVAACSASQPAAPSNTGPGIAAAAHAAQVLAFEGPAAGLAHGLATASLFSETSAIRECELDGDRLSVPDAPGLGVELDEDALARLRI